MIDADGDPVIADPAMPTERRARFDREARADARGAGRNPILRARFGV
jgi:hypothetical protein